MSKIKKIVFSIIGSVALVGTGLGFGLGFGLPKKGLDGISNSDTSSYTPVAEIWNKDMQAFNKYSVQRLYTCLSDKGASATFSDIENLASVNTTSADIRTNNNGKDVVVRLGGLDWQVMYLSTDSDYNTIATLWLSNNYQDAFAGRSQTEGLYYGYYYDSTTGKTGLYSDWAADQHNSYFTVDYPTNMYGSSYVSVVTLNNGGTYAKILGTESSSTSTLTTYTPSTNSAFAEFTIPIDGENNDLTDFIVTPNKVPYQAGQNSINNGINEKNTLPNESTTALSDANWYTSSYGSASAMVSNPYYYAWTDDYLWLPSRSEIGYNDTYIGIWKASVAQRENADGSTNSISNVGTIGSLNTNNATIAYNYSWLRSGLSGNATMATIPNVSGPTNATRHVSQTHSVQPALHLNLTLMNECIYDDTSDLEMPFIPSDMTKWTEYTYGAHMSESYSEMQDISWVTATGIDGYERLGYKFSCKPYTNYRIAFKLTMPNFSPLAGSYGGLTFCVSSYEPYNGNDVGDRGYIILYPNQDGIAELIFNSGGNSTLYCAFNFGHVADGYTYTYSFSHFNNSWDFKADKDWEGSGTLADPYLISSAKELAGLSASVNYEGNYSGACFKQTANIDLGGLEWTPIGRGNDFCGTYDGGNFTISNMNIDSAIDNTGLFAKLNNGAHIKNVRLTNASVRSSAIYTGGLVGYASDVFVSDCSVQGYVEYTGTASSSDIFMGGVFGYVYMAWSISGIKSNVDVIGNSNAYVACVGGIAGALLNSDITKSSNSGYIYNHGWNTGGIAGYTKSSLIDSCEFSGNIYCSDINTAGIVGYTQGGSITKCIVTDTTIAHGNFNAGLIVGKNEISALTISDCVASGQIKSKDRRNVGGIIGESNGTGSVVTISNCSAILSLDRSWGESVEGYSGVFYGHLHANGGTVTFSGGNYGIANGKKFYMGEDFSGFGVVKNMNNNLPMQKSLFHIAEIDTETNILQYLISLGYQEGNS